MKTFRVKVQFFSPDKIPTATGEFLIEAEDKLHAMAKQTDNCLEWGYQQDEVSIISADEVE